MLGGAEQDIASSRISRAKRLKKIRKMTGLSRSAFSQKHGISKGTLQNWETARFGGLTEKGAKACLQAFKQDGVIINFEWLMYGVGAGPRLLSTPSQSDETTVFNTPEQAQKALQKELREFQRLQTAETLTYQVEDNHMAPVFSPGQMLAGKKREGQDLQACVGKHCIIETQSGKVVLRKVYAGSKPGLFHLACLTMDSHERRPIAYDIALASAAPVIWVRTPESEDTLSS